MKKILLYLGIMLIGCGISFFGFRYALQAAKFGAISIPDAPYLFITTLQSNISTADTSMTLNSGTLKNGSSLSGYQCFTVDTGTATAEYVCGTASGASITSLIRGIDPMNPAATSSTLVYSHRRGADVRITDFPILQITKRLINGQDSFPSSLSYDTSVASSSLSGQNLASVNFVTSQVNQGAATATGTTPGVVELSSRTQLSAGTAMDGAYTLVPQNAFFNSTFQAATTVPVTGANGKLAQTFLDLTQAWTFTATTTLAATSTAPLTLRGVNYAFPASQGTASSTLINDGSGNLTWGDTRVFKSGVTTHDISATGTQTIAHGVGATPKRIEIITYINPGINAVMSTSDGTYNGTTVSTIYSTFNSAGNSGANPQPGTTASYIVYLSTQEYGSSLRAYATVSMDATNITLTWDKLNSPTGTAYLMWKAEY